MLPTRPMLPPTPPLSRRRWLRWSAVSVLPLAGACGSPLPLLPLWQDAAAAGPSASSVAARARLLATANAHGLAAYGDINDINIAYDGIWRPLIDGVQPQVVDAGYRGASEERLLPRLGLNAQAYRGPRGRKHVAWQRDGSTATATVGVWYDGQASSDAGSRQAAALVADVYGLFLLGPLWLATRSSFDSLPMQMSGTERVDGHLCDAVDVALRPGFGFSAYDRLTLCIDRDDAVTRRLRLTLEGYEGTRGAVAQVDHFEHRQLFGVLWPVRSFEEVVHPIRLPAHDWHVTGLDVNRGYGAEALLGDGFSGAALRPATPI